ncbi:MAG: ribonuclease HII [Fervidicoccaceae archaeon]
MRVLGLDEAGRGSLVGPLVVAGVVLNGGASKELKELGLKDSKLLSRSARERLFEEVLRRAVWHRVILVPPRILDERNINNVTLECYVLLARLSAAEAGVEAVVADMVGAGAARRELPLPEGPRIIMEARADRRYVEVSAASVIAKVTRDRIIEIYRMDVGLRGSGYPSDPKTVEWLVERWSKDPALEVVRTKWKTLRRLGLGPKR